MIFSCFLLIPIKHCFCRWTRKVYVSSFERGTGACRSCGTGLEAQMMNVGMVGGQESSGNNVQCVQNIQPYRCVKSWNYNKETTPQVPTEPADQDAGVSRFGLRCVSSSAVSRCAAALETRGTSQGCEEASRRLRSGWVAVRPTVTCGGRFCR